MLDRQLKSNLGKLEPASDPGSVLLTGPVLLGKIAISLHSDLAFAACNMFNLSHYFTVALCPEYWCSGC